MNQSSFLRCYRLFPPLCLNCLTMILIIGFPRIWQHIQVMEIGPALSSKSWPSNRQSCWYSSWESATIYVILRRGHTGISCIFFQFCFFQGRSHCFLQSFMLLPNRRISMNFEVRTHAKAIRSLRRRKVVGGRAFWFTFECNTLIQTELWFCYWIEGQANSES